MTYLYCNWKFVSLSLPLLFHSCIHLPLLWQLPVCSLWTCVCFIMFVCWLCFLDSTCKWNHTVFIFLWLISLKFECILIILHFNSLPWSLIFLTYFTPFCSVYRLTTYCRYRWLYYFCLLTFVLVSQVVDLLSLLYVCLY